MGGGGGGGGGGVGTRSRTRGWKGVVKIPSNKNWLLLLNLMYNKCLSQCRDCTFEIHPKPSLMGPSWLSTALANSPQLTRFAESALDVTMLLLSNSTLTSAYLYSKSVSVTLYEVHSQCISQSRVICEGGWQEGCPFI